MRTGLDRGSLRTRARVHRERMNAEGRVGAQVDGLREVTKERKRVGAYLQFLLTLDQSQTPPRRLRRGASGVSAATPPAVEVTFMHEVEMMDMGGRTTVEQTRKPAYGKDICSHTRSDICSLRISPLYRYCSVSLPSSRPRLAISSSFRTFIYE
eukprot:GHVU01167556.1.p1 GENE.GHVU01167556.1~~GHVU01167556.1.p1  ORF type:complete len:154 (-),score=8.14 GHVU01167556.1:238-699(-)